MRCRRTSSPAQASARKAGRRSGGNSRAALKTINSRSGESGIGIFIFHFSKAQNERKKRKENQIFQWAAGFYFSTSGWKAPEFTGYPGMLEFIGGGKFWFEAIISSQAGKK
jgi:hypothetical protein